MLLYHLLRAEGTEYCICIRGRKFWTQEFIRVIYMSVENMHAMVFFFVWYSANAFQLVNVDLGKLKSVTIRHDNEGGKESWFISQVNIAISSLYTGCLKKGDQLWHVKCVNYLVCKHDFRIVKMRVLAVEWRVSFEHCEQDRTNMRRIKIVGQNHIFSPNKQLCVIKENGD
jgi:hypothetical protein